MFNHQLANDDGTVLITTITDANDSPQSQESLAVHAFDAITGATKQLWTSQNEGLEIGHGLAIDGGVALIGGKPWTTVADYRPWGSDDFYGADPINDVEQSAGQVLRFDVDSGKLLSVINGATLDVISPYGTEEFGTRLTSEGGLGLIGANDFRR